MLKRILILAALFLPGAAAAQGFPTRPVTMVVPFAAGGPTDTITRIVAERMRVALGQTVVIENVTGADVASASAAPRARRPTATRSASASGAPMCSTAPPIRCPTMS
jgi:tripartite-type tricarboxylate transporter receptor subunit TctC